MEITEYSILKNISHHPAFVWRVHHGVRKKKIIISKIKCLYWQTTHRYGVNLPNTTTEALEVHKENNNTLWWDVICSAMHNVRITFEEFDCPLSQMLPGFKKLNCHLIFEVKLSENFRRKARFVADGHRTTAPKSLSYSTVVSRDSVRIAFLLAALNNLQVVSCDIQNTYLAAPCREKFYYIAGAEFGSDQGKIYIVRRALYGLKTSGASFRKFLAESFTDMGFRSCTRADPDVWMRPQTKPDGFRYYEYFLAYVDDLLFVSHDPTTGMEELLQHEGIKLKNNKFAPPNTFLGSQLQLKKIIGCYIWTQNSAKYIDTAIKTVEEALLSRKIIMPTKAKNPFASVCHPELDYSSELDADDTMFCQDMVGILLWAVE